MTKDFQGFALWIADSLGDRKYLKLYISFAKYQDWNLLREAASYVKDYPEARSNHKLFMWYLKGKLKKIPKKRKAKARKLF